MLMLTHTFTSTFIDIDNDTFIDTYSGTYFDTYIGTYIGTDVRASVRTVRRVLQPMIEMYLNLRFRGNPAARCSWQSRPFRKKERGQFVGGVGGRTIVSCFTSGLISIWSCWHQTNTSPICEVLTDTVCREKRDSTTSGQRNARDGKHIAASEVLATTSGHDTQETENTLLSDQPAKMLLNRVQQCARFLVLQTQPHEGTNLDRSCGLRDCFSAFHPDSGTPLHDARGLQFERNRICILSSS